MQCTFRHPSLNRLSPIFALALLVGPPALAEDWAAGPDEELLEPSPPPFVVPPVERLHARLHRRPHDPHRPRHAAPSDLGAEGGVAADDDPPGLREEVLVDRTVEDGVELLVRHPGVGSREVRFRGGVSPRCREELTRRGWRVSAAGDPPTE